MGKPSIIGKCRVEAIAPSAKVVAEIARDMASFSTTEDAAVPQQGLGISLQAVEREAALLGGLDNLDVVFAYAGAFGTFIARSVAPDLHDRALTQFQEVAKAAAAQCRQSGLFDGAGR